MSTKFLSLFNTGLFACKKRFYQGFLTKRAFLSQDFLTRRMLASQAVVPHLIQPLYKGDIVCREHSSTPKNGGLVTKTLK